MKIRGGTITASFSHTLSISFTFTFSLLPSLLPSDIKIRNPPIHSHTPPYVTALPDVQYRKFELPSSSPPGSRSTLRFIILATDGLWDEISNSQAVALVGGHLTGYRGAIPATQINKRIPTVETTLQKWPTATIPGFGSTATPSAPMPHSAVKTKNTDWAFRDESVAMHLIRNAVGGNDDIRIRQSLSIPPPYTRRHRDDITVAVITFDDQGDQGTGQVKAKAKL